MEKQKEKKVKLFYAGQRLNGGKLVYSYSKSIPLIQANGEFFRGIHKENLMLFSKKLMGYETIGVCISAVEHEKGVKSPYSILNDRAPKEIITMWSTRQANDIGHKKLMSEASTKLDGDIDLLIKAIKKYSPSMRQAAIYALLKLL